MQCCDKLVHPFQNDPGTSQNQRVMESLLSKAVQIDSRKLADLLHYFVQLSRHINYYDRELKVSDWQPFLNQSLPFTVAAMVKYNTRETRGKLELYQSIFNRGPSTSGLQLSVHFIYYSTIYLINQWQLKTKRSELPLEHLLEQVIRNQLIEPVKRFIALSNAASKWYCIKRLDFSSLVNNEVWDLNIRDLHSQDQQFLNEASLPQEQLQIIYKSILDLFPTFLEAIKMLSLNAADNLEASLLPLKAELMEKHPPHLSLLFAFLSLFQKLQGHLNGFTRKHLDFFYQDVLRLKTKEAVPDKAHLIFEIQKQLKKHLLKKGLLIKDSKDANKQEILFGLDDEIVINQTQIAESRTLFLNNQSEQNHHFLEGVYMAPNANMADGVEKPFDEDIPKSFPTLGDKPSRYTAPGQAVFQNYPQGRVGFILASPVLLLNEGSRRVKITMACRLDDPICGPDYPNFFSSEQLYLTIKQLFRKTFYLVTQELIDEASKLGISKDTSDKLKEFLFERLKQSCEGRIRIYQSKVQLTAGQWHQQFFKHLSPEEKEIIGKLFKARRIFKLHFSGEKEWIEPSHYKKVKFTPLTTFADGSKRFAIKIITKLDPDKPAVTFYNSENLKEDLKTELPLVKMELDDQLKLYRGFNVEGAPCCLKKPGNSSQRSLSFYHFLRNIVIVKENDEPDHYGNTYETKIEVKVCGLQNFVVQNDESVQDVNSPIYPFGTRPDVVDFDGINPLNEYCINQEFIDDPLLAGIHANNKTFLQDKIKNTGEFHVGTTIDEIDDFLLQLPVAADAGTIKALLSNPNRKFCSKNLIGPNFLIGSKEVLCKKWQDIFINLNWKDKPVDFNEYYKAYWANPYDTSIHGLDEEGFQYNLSVLQDLKWVKEKGHPLPPPPTTTEHPVTHDHNRPLFRDDGDASFCNAPNPWEQTIRISNGQFDGLDLDFRISKGSRLTRFDVDTKYGFVRMNLQNQDFMHKKYAFVLARQMMAFGKYPDALVESAVYEKVGGTIIVFKNFGTTLLLLKTLVQDSKNLSEAARDEVRDVYNTFTAATNFTPPIPIPPDPPPNAGSLTDSISDAERDALLTEIYEALVKAIDTLSKTTNLSDAYKLLEDIYSLFDPFGNKVVEPLTIPIPNEPWTPIIKEMSLDYTSSASLEDIDLIHLYPYHGTYLHKELGLTPTLLPTHCDQGTLFIGLKDLIPKSNLNVLFQLAEATADSEMERVPVQWMYLDNNQWRTLRPGFEVLDDATDGLTASGLIKFAFPENITLENSIMPAGLHWIKASVPKNSQTISQAIGLHTQAIRATFTLEEANDRSRLNEALAAGKLSKLQVADALVKKVQQPYESFQGRVPEADGHYYVRVSELLRHKGRAIQKFDYERLTLEAFPDLFRVKCIQHSFGLDANAFRNDFPLSPGYILLAVIPDIRKLKAGNSFQPKVPVSKLEGIREYLMDRTSPFVRLSVMNPRYEYVDFSLEVKLYLGKDENYYKELLRQELREFLAPWVLGHHDKITFGQCIYRSDIVQFLEMRDYLDYIVEMKMAPRDEAPDQRQEVCPSTPRSILIAGEIDLCITQNDCEQWAEEGCDHPAVEIMDYCKEDIG